MLHAARPRGRIRGCRRESRTSRKRERFETETRVVASNRRHPVVPACAALTPAPGHYRGVASARHRRAAYNRPTVAART